MKISNYAFLSPTFNAKNPNIRKADKIVRNVNVNFPMFSPTYAESNWIVYNSDDDTFEKNKNVLYKYQEKVKKIRNEYDEVQDYDKYFLKLFELIKKEKVGNCFEAVWLTLGALCANGFCGSTRCDVVVRINVIDRRNGKSVYHKDSGFDHTLILTTMEKQTKKEQDLIVVDPWLNRVMSYSEAKEYYLSLIKEWDMLLRVHDCQKDFMEKNMVKSGIFAKNFLMILIREIIYLNLKLFLPNMTILINWRHIKMLVNLATLFAKDILNC